MKLSLAFSVKVEILAFKERPKLVAFLNLGYREYPHNLSDIRCFSCLLIGEFLSKPTQNQNQLVMGGETLFKFKVWDVWLLYSHHCPSRIVELSPTCVVSYFRAHEVCVNKSGLARNELSTAMFNFQHKHLVLELFLEMVDMYYSLDTEFWICFKPIELALWATRT